MKRLPPFRLRRPMHLVLLADSLLYYVADFGNDRIQVWRCVTCEG